MILLLFVFLPIVGGLLAWCVGERPAWARGIALLTCAAELAAGLWLWRTQGPWAYGTWNVSFRHEWVPALGISFHLAMDGLSLLLVLLTAFLGMMAVAASWNEVRERVGFFHFNLLACLAGIAGVFMAMDLFLFYFFWELMLVPMYFLFLWGHEGRRRAAIKFFIFTQAGGVLMLVSIVGLYMIHAFTTGRFTFEYQALLGTWTSPVVGMWLMLGFFAAFAVKMGAVPLHGWLPDAYTHAPTAGSVILAALMAKTGAYGLIRFGIPLFPDAARVFAPVGMLLGVISILYGAAMAFSQRDIKRVVAYASVSGMGFVMLGIFAWNALSMHGVVIQMLSHGVVIGALFTLCGALQERLQTRELGQMGGLWSTAPRMGGVMLFFALAAMGLPGMGNFVGEFLVLAGTWQHSVTLAAVAAGGAILAAIYVTRLIQKSFFGPNSGEHKIADLSARERVMAVAAIVIVVWLGLSPNGVIGTLSRNGGSSQGEAIEEPVGMNSPMLMSKPATHAIESQGRNGGEK